MNHDDRHYEDRVVGIYELASDEAEVAGYTFIGCHIKGPAVLIILGDTVVMQSQMGTAGADAILWEIPPERTQVVGAIGVRDCHFEGCSFDKIGFAGSVAQIAAMRASLG